MGKRGANPVQMVNGDTPKTLCWKKRKPIKQEGMQRSHCEASHPSEVRTALTDCFTTLTYLSTYPLPYGC